MDKRKLFVANLDYSITDEELKGQFQAIGEVVEAVIIKDHTSGRSKGFGFVTMIDEGTAQLAIEKLNGVALMKRNIIVKIANPKNK